MMAYFQRLHVKMGDFWWYSLMLFIASGAAASVATLVESTVLRQRLPDLDSALLRRQRDQSHRLPSGDAGEKARAIGPEANTTHMT